MLKKPYVLRSLLLLTVLLFAAGIAFYVAKQQDMKLEQRLNAVDERILQHTSLEFLKEKTDVDKLIAELQKRIADYEENIKKMDPFLAHFGLTMQNTWQEWEKAIDRECRSKLGFPFKSEEFRSFYQRNIASDGGIGWREMKKSPFYQSVILFLDIEEAANAPIPSSSSIEYVVKQYMISTQYEVVIEPYLEEVLGSEFSHRIPLTTAAPSEAGSERKSTVR